MRIELPQVGESVTEGMIGKWLKSVGDAVEKYEPLVEVVTDKVNMEFPSPCGGVLTKILVDEGDTVPMGSAIAEIAVEGEAEPGPGADGTQGADRLGTLVEDAAPVGPTGSGGVPQAAPESEGPARAPGKRLSPAVRRLAEQRGIDLSAVSGTGIGGRVTLRDVRAYAASAERAVHAPADGGGDRVEYLDVTPVRKMIAANMERSAREIPSAWSMVEVDVTGLVSVRGRLKDEFAEREGAKLTYLPFVVAAAAACLKEHPLLNSTWEGSRIALLKDINIGIAVSTPRGLMVPVIHNADRMSARAIAVRLDALASGARQGRLDVSDVRGGTFTVNNTGALGSVLSRPLINPPQAAILTAEAIVKRPVVIDDAIAIRSVMNVGLTFDHRIMDGAEAGAFLAQLKSGLQSIREPQRFWE